MTHVLSLMLWLVATQTVGEPAVPAPASAPAAAPAAAPVTVPGEVVVQCAPGDAERALSAELDEARAQLAEAKQQVAKLKEEAGMADHAVATLLVSDRPDLAPLERFSRRSATGAGRGRIRYVEAQVYLSPHPGETMTAVVLTLRNPREAPAWEPKEAYLRTPYYRGDPPVPVAVRASPEHIRPGQAARIALVFDLLDVRLDEPYATLALLRDGEWEMEIEMHPCDFQVASAMSGGNQ